MGFRDLGVLAAPATRAPKPVLLVNGSPDALEMYRLGLDLAGFDAVIASDAASARHAVEDRHPVAIVANIGPGGAFDEWQLIEAIGSNAPQQVPIVLLTARVDPVIRSQAARAGVAELVQIPCLPEELADVLERLSRQAAPGSSVTAAASERRRHRRGEAEREPHRASLKAMMVGTYREMPGLLLSLRQAARLFGLRERTCEMVLADLVQEGLLRRSTDGQYLGSGAVR